jgi:signal peptidase I
VNETGNQFAPETQPTASPSADVEAPTLPETAAPVSVTEPPPIPASDRNHEPDTGWVGTVQSLLVTVIIAVFVITFIVQAFQIPSESMENTLLIGDYLLVDKAHYGPAGIWDWLIPYQKIKRGDIIVFRYPVNPSQHFVKRVIGVPGDHIRLIDKQVFVNGKPLNEPYAIHSQSVVIPFRDDFPNGDLGPEHLGGAWARELLRLTEDHQLIVPRNCYFAMGDNRDESYDSRYWGFVPRENIVGRPLLIYWSVRQRNPADVYTDEGTADDKLAGLISRIERGWHSMRWHRMFTLVR